jgi:endoglucanase
LYSTPLRAGDAATQFSAGACPQAATAAPAPTASRRTLPALPLHVRGRSVVDPHGHRVKLAGVNWYGAEGLDRVPAGLQCQSIDAVAAHIAADGFNVVRLPWATSTWVGAAPSVPPVAVAANPQLRGVDARGVFDAVIAGLARHGLMVILDNHVTRADWCCSGTDGNALWWEGYDPRHPPHWSRMSARARTAYFLAGHRQWLRAWRAVAARYGARGSHPQRAVVGADLRNEPRIDWTLGIRPAWTTRNVPAWQDWPRAAEQGGNTVLRANPRLVVAVEGLKYATDLRGAAQRPIRLRRAHHRIYSAHDYPFFHAATISYAALHARLGERWGYLLARGHRWTAPVWVGEFGACHPDGPSCGDGAWFGAFTRYLRDGDIDFAYWSVNGTGARGGGEPSTCTQTPRFPGCDEGYGISDVSWARDVSPALSVALRSLTTRR